MSDDYISLLPEYSAPTTIMFGDQLPCHEAKIASVPIERILRKIKRKVWIEGLYTREIDLTQINRYKNPDGCYKNNFDEIQFLDWIKVIESNTALCDMENKKVGKGIFVPPGKNLPKGTFIPVSGIIKLNPTKMELETGNHCSALQDLNSPERKIYGIIDPGKRGGIFDLINHAPIAEEIANFKFKSKSIKENVATANLTSTIKFYRGYAIMGAEASLAIEGGKYGRQLLWSYAQPDEYLSHRQSQFNHSNLYLFDNRNEHNGEIIDSANYSLRKIDIFLNIEEMMLRKVASITRWEIMESPPEAGLVFAVEDPYSSAQSETIPSSIFYGFLQSYLKRNPDADRIIIRIPPSIRTHTPIKRLPLPKEK